MSRRRTRVRRGAALFETIVALTIATIAGIAWIALAAQTEASVRAIRAREALMREAGNTMERIALWDRSGFDARVGMSRYGDFVLTVQLLAPSVYSATLSDTLEQRPVLATTVYAVDRVATDVHE